MFGSIFELFYLNSREIKNSGKFLRGPSENGICNRFHFLFFLRFFTIYYLRQKFLNMKRLITLLFFLFTINSFSQERYANLLFDEVSMETYTYATKDGENLDLDIYRSVLDSEPERATLIYLHGGGFSGGERNSEQIQEFCRQMAGYGYVVASISYRLTRKDQPGGFGCDCPADEKLNTFYAAVEDLQDATYFLIERREQFSIDPLKIIIAGSSAGAETVLNAAYQPPYCYDLPSGPVSYAGVISMSGAIPDTMVMYDESAIPSMFFHGTDDLLVPYGTAPHHYCNEDTPGYLILHGPKTIAQKLEELEVPYWLYTFCGGGHEIANSPLADNFDDIIGFCYDFVINKETETRKTIIKNPQKNKDVEQFDFCSEEN